MAILESCCFWKNVRKGSFAAAIYTLVYFSFSTIMLLFYVHEEREFLFGQRARPVGESLLERGDVSVATVIFNILFLICSLLMICASILLIMGLKINRRQLLIPWIFFMLCDLIIELAHLAHLSLAHRVIFDPIVGFIFTIDFFILCLNLYCLLCVISQYQEYREQHDRFRPALSPTVQFTTPQKLKKSPTMRMKHKPRRLLAFSPLANSQRMTNFSTITEEEDEHSKSKAQQSLAATNDYADIVEDTNTNENATAKKSTLTLDVNVNASPH